MENVEERAMATTDIPPPLTNGIGMWKLDSVYAMKFSGHWNTLNLDIKFTTETPPQCAMRMGHLRYPWTASPLILVNTSISYATITSVTKCVVRTLHHCTQMVITEEESWKQETDHVNKFLKNCGFTWI